MARPQGTMRVSRYFAVLALILVGAYLGVFLGGKDYTPKLGLDLQGGTTVTLQALTTSGKAPSATELETARQIIENRVNGLGVSSAEVVTEGDRNIVISVPGVEGQQAKQLGQTAQLELRPVIQDIGPAGAATATSSEGAGVSGTATGSATASASASASAADGTASSSPSANPRPVPPVQAPASGSTPAASATPAASDSAAPATNNDEIGQALGSDTAEGAAAIAATLDCSKQTSPQAPTVTQYMASCSTDGTNSRYVLGPVLIKGTQVDKASSGYDTQGGQGWLISVNFNSAGTSTWAAYTTANVGKQVAFVLDQRVLSAPVINSAIVGTTQISGSFTQVSAEALANALNFGALPLNFTQSEARTISATLGLESLKAGLIAGGIGLALVVLYCLAYYRALGIVTVISLALSGAIVYAALVLLGRGIGFTLTLSGIAGFIVAIGITADSFVVYFERLKDEIREGRPIKSAVPRAWIRARKTILSADAVSFLAAAILYFLTVGEVKGFAFTLGLSTVLDLLVVYFFTHPLVAWLSRFDSFASPTFSGLGKSVRAGRVSGTKPKPGSAKDRAVARRAALKES